MLSARAVARIVVPIALVLGLIFSQAAPAAGSAEPTDFQSVFKLAKTKVGDPWKHYATGPNKFDCVGYVWFIFAKNGLKDKIGGYRGVKSYYRWFKRRGRVSRSHPKVGDLIIWGNFQHVGMYIGNGKAISALVNPWGVRVHPVKGWLNEPFRYYLHTRITR